MSNPKYMTLPDGREVLAEDYMMAYAPLSVVRRVCEPIGPRPTPSLSRPQGRPAPEPGTNSKSKD